MHGRQLAMGSTTYRGHAIYDIVVLFLNSSLVLPMDHQSVFFTDSKMARDKEAGSNFLRDLLKLDQAQ